MVPRVIVVHTNDGAGEGSYRDAIKGKVVRHQCDNPSCYRYDHLLIGSQKDNVQDAVERGRYRNHNAEKTHCKRGHEFDDENTYVNPSGARQCRACITIRRMAK